MSVVGARDPYCPLRLYIAGVVCVHVCVCVCIRGRVTVLRQWKNRNRCVYYVQVAKHVKHTKY